MAIASCEYEEKDVYMQLANSFEHTIINSTRLNFNHNLINFFQNLSAIIMQNLITILTTATLAMSAAVPAPVDLETRRAAICPGLLGTPQCCALSVLGVATLPCADRK